MHSDKNIYKIVEINDVGNFEEKTNLISKILTLLIFSHRVAYTYCSLFNQIPCVFFPEYIRFKSIPNLRITPVFAYYGLITPGI